MPIIHPIIAGASNDTTIEAPTTNLWGHWMGSEVYTETSGTPSTRQTTDGGDIGSLKDMSGNGRHFYQTTASAKPHMEEAPTGFNGEDCIDFTSQYMVTTGSVYWPDNFSIYVVAERDAWVTLGVLTGSPTAGTGIFFQDGNAGQGASSPNFYCGNGVPESNAAGPYSLTNGSPFLAAGSKDASENTSLRVDDSSTLTGTTYAFNSTLLMWLGYSGGSAYWNGRLAEFLLYDTAHTFTTGDGLQARQYLNQKYDLGLGI